MTSRNAIGPLLAILALGVLFVGCKKPYELPESEEFDESPRELRVPASTAWTRFPMTRTSSGETIGWARLGRSPAGLVARLGGELPLDGHAVTVWALVFNRPEACSSRPCPSSDLAAAEGVSLKLDGLVARRGGRPFRGRLSAGASTGISNPMGADVRLIVRTHGPAIPGRIEEQLASANGACDVDVTPAMPVNDGECSSVAAGARSGGEFWIGRDR